VSKIAEPKTKELMLNQPKRKRKRKKQTTKVLIPLKQSKQFFCLSKLVRKNDEKAKENIRG
jgi:hypothetical protein